MKSAGREEPGLGILTEGSMAGRAAGKERKYVEEVWLILLYGIILLSKSPSGQADFIAKPEYITRLPLTDTHH